MVYAWRIVIYTLFRVLGRGQVAVGNQSRGKLFEPKSLIVLLELKGYVDPFVCV